jgi:peptidoglycan glycosyltransferase
MKQVKNRTLFVLVFAAALLVGLVIFVGSYVLEGSSWASFSANRHVYTNGKISSGTITDRNGTLLHDCATQSYAGDATTRAALLHVLGDGSGNISTGALNLFSSQLVGYDPIFGTSGSGNRVSLSVDAQLCKTAYQLLEGKSGTVALYNYRTGQVLCMVSAPAFDPTNASQVAAVASGDSAYTGAYVNRFLSATYTPGSTFKLVTAAAALETLGQSAMEDFSYTCTGTLTVDGTQVTCPSAHGTQTFGQALTNSCNCAFATLALQLGGNTLQAYTEKAGLLGRLTVDGVPTAAGSFTASPDGSSELAWSGVGQSTTLVNPCTQLALMGCIAGGGTAAAPELLNTVTSPFGLPMGSGSVTTYSIDWDEDTCSTLKWMMRDNVKNKYADTLDFGDLSVCAKSGTAEVGSGKPHAWFTGFVDSDQYPYAFVVVVEHGGGGASVAGSIAAQLLQAACS